MSFTTSHIDVIPGGSGVSLLAARVRASIRTAAQSLDNASTAWGTLPHQMWLPEDMREFFAAYDPVDTSMSTLKERGDSVCTALETFAETLSGLVKQREQVHRDIATFDRTYPPGTELSLAESWRKGREENRIESAIHMIAVRYEMAEDDLLRAISMHQVPRVMAVPMHFPGGDSFDHAQARVLIDALSGTGSQDRYRDYRQLLKILASMSPSELARLARENPNLATLVPPQGANAGTNRAWWDGLMRKPGGADLRAALTEYAPSLIGNMEGLTYADRNRANQRTLEIVLERVRQQQAGEWNWNYTDNQIRAFENLEKTLEHGRARMGSAGTHIGLLSFDAIGVNGEPLAAISIGDPDTATHQSWYIPGMGSSLDRNIGGVYGDAEAIFNAQHKHLGTGDSHNMIVWMGYDAPPMPTGNSSDPGLVHADVLRSDHARDGGHRLKNALNGMNVANTHRDGPMPHTSVVAHSYGTTTATYALAQLDHKVDSAVFFGSAGLDQAAAETAADLQVTTNPETGRPNVYAGTAAKDHVARLPMQIGSQEGWGPPRYSPTDKAFGGNVFQVDGGEEGHAVGRHDAQHANGDGYLDDGTQSLDAISRLSVGNQDVELWDEAWKDEKEDQNAEMLFRALSEGNPYVTFPSDGAPERLN